MKTVIKVENLSKQYRLGQVGTGTLSHDLNRWWHRVRGKEDPYLKIGESNDRSSRGASEYVWALKDINFEVKEGEVLGIIGKNGAGKSTLLKILSKVTGPTTGAIKAKGRIASLLEVGTGFHPELTGRENIYLNGTILGMTKAEVKAKLDEIVDFAGVARYLDTPVKRYSSGMMVRLGFAVAAHLEPEILIVDEVLAVGDAEFQKKAIGKMKDVSQSGGRTVLFVSHNMGSVKQLCFKSLLMENGKIKSIGETDEIIDKYLSKSNGSEYFRDEILKYRRKGGGNLVYIESLLINGQERKAIDIPIMGSVTIRLNVYSKIKVKGLIVTVVILNEKLEVVSTNLSADKGMYLDLDLGTNSLLISFNELNFKIGKYYLNIGINQSVNSKAYDVLEEIPAFNIVNTGNYAVTLREGRQGHILHNNIMWTYDSINSRV